MVHQTGHYHHVQSPDQSINRLLLRRQRENHLGKTTKITHRRFIRSISLNLGYARWHRTSKLHLNTLVGILSRNPIKIGGVLTIQNILHVNLRRKGKCIWYGRIRKNHFLIHRTEHSITPFYFKCYPPHFYINIASWSSQERPTKINWVPSVSVIFAMIKSSKTQISPTLTGTSSNLPIVAF